jgi:hypothetical protein
MREEVWVPSPEPAVPDIGADAQRFPTVALFLFVLVSRGGVS